MEEILKKLKEHDSQLDLLARTATEHTERLEWLEKNVATKDDMSKVFDKLDTIVGLYKIKDEELTLLAHGQRDLGDRVEILEKDMQQVKPALGLA